MRSVLYLVFALFFLSACDDDQPNFDNIDALAGTWQLKGILFQGDIGITVPTDVTITFVDASGDFKFNGDSSCNIYGGDITKVNAKDIAFNGFFATEIACLGDKGSFESLYFDFIPQISQYRFDNETLVLFFDNNYLYFEKE